MRRIVGQIWRLTRIATSGREGRRGILIYGVVLALQFVGIWFAIRLIAWSKDFYDALEQMDAAAALHQVGVFFALIAVSAAANLVGKWLRKSLLMVWRDRLTQRALDLWVGGRAYWHLRPGLSPVAVDNPDQRIAEDCRSFVEVLLNETLDVISSVVALFSYVALLWSLSTFPLVFTAFGVEVSVARYMVWAAFLYVALATVVTHRLGRPLKQRMFEQERREADFRHALVQMREAATEIAQAGGEVAERRRLTALFAAIRANWRRLIGREFVLGLFTQPYHQTVLRIPTFLALPAYFGGAVTLGGLMQLASAFSQVTTTLSWYVFSFSALAEGAAVAERLDGLFSSAAAPAPMPGAPRDLVVKPGGVMELRGLRLATPDGGSLAPVPDVTVRPGDRVWIAGPSGVGKSTLLAAVSGLWPYGEGRITRPGGRMICLSQHTYVIAEGLAAAACYPDDPAEHDPARLRAVLVRLGLGHRLAGLDQPGPGPMQGLSPGERQRLALARVLLHRPDWILLDEATSALDPVAEAEVLALLHDELPGSAILCVAHRPPVVLAPYVTLRLGEGRAARLSA
jgi:putative ATP-binding cassette transporter